MQAAIVALAAVVIMALLGSLGDFFNKRSRISPGLGDFLEMQNTGIRFGSDLIDNIEKNGLTAEDRKMISRVTKH